MGWIIGITAFVVINLIVLIIFSWRNAKASVKPNVLTLEREEDYNRKRGLWLDFDSYDKTSYEIKGKDGYILHAEFVDCPSVRENGRYMILCHGHTSNRYGSVKYLNCYIKLMVRTHLINVLWVMLKRKICFVSLMIRAPDTVI